MPAGDGCFLVNPLKEDGRYDLFFFYLLQIGNKVLQLSTEPIASTVAFKYLSYQIVQRLC